jgi:uncharacterized coiled-coil DUF342 family protein
MQTFYEAALYVLLELLTLLWSCLQELRAVAEEKRNKFVQLGERIHNMHNKFAEHYEVSTILLLSV